MRLKYVFSIQEVADKFVAVAKNHETETVESVFNLNETGALILKALQDGKNTLAIVNLLMSEYDVLPQEAEDEVNAFINMLIDNKLAAR